VCLESAHAVGVEREAPAAVGLGIGNLVVEGLENLLPVHAEGIEKRGDRDLPPPIDTGMHDVLGVELDVEPGAAIRNDARREKELAEEWVLPLSWSKKTPGLRCICETMTRSVPLTMKVPLLVINGISPI